MAISVVHFPQRPLPVFHVLDRILLLLFHIATFALHLVVGLSPLRAADLPGFPGLLPVLLLDL